ncbi:hypothetical protein [Streptomyces canus]|uniref:hypothetical protein n=1 Tax=Streptomyces canus TaxID=58343 RepID=UPI0007460B7E|nr:hypothetical protein [Streptomyces canus]KUN05641.1 hypothetical protein AQI96_33805 [Streptomyces canus]
MKPMAKLALPPLAVAGGLLIAVAGTSLAQGESTPRADAVAPVAKAFVGDPEDPATWRLPVETYAPTKAQTRMVSATRDELIDACMDKQGSPEWTPAPDLPDLGGTTLTDWRYGIHDAEEAHAYGYHPDPEAQKAYDDALAQDQSGNTDRDVLRSCVDEADGGVPRLAVSPLVNQIGGYSYQMARETPEVQKVFEQWSECMKTKGYTYAQPMEAAEDARFITSDKATELEKDTAVADVACRDKFHVEKTWFDAEARIQEQEISKSQQELEEQRAGIKAAVAKARALD